MKKQVQYLRKGDKISSGAIVTSDPWIDTTTPSGKMFINIKYPKDPENGYTRTWGKYTEIGIVS